MLSGGFVASELSARGWKPDRLHHRWDHPSGATARLDPLPVRGQGVVLIYDRRGVLSNALRYGGEQAATPERFELALTTVELGSNQRVAAK